MNLSSCPPHPLGEKRDARHSLLIAMRLAILLTLFCCFKVTAAVFAQKVSLNLKDVPIETALQEIKKQSGYSLIMKDGLLDRTGKVTLFIRNATIKEALDACFKGQHIGYQLVGKTIVLKRIADFNGKAMIAIDTNITVTVTDNLGKPLPGATVQIKGTQRTVITGQQGSFFLNKVPLNAVLVVSYVGYQSQEINISSLGGKNIQLETTTSALNEVVVIPYGTTTRRLNTGDISKVSSKEIESQPVMNPIAALAGRVPGLTVVQNSGLPGSNFAINIRGRTSINTNISNDPLFIIDGVPFANNNNDVTALANATSTTGGLSPFNTLNPSDIESIEVLKDADATSIYGSRGANGVILITTKKGKAGTVTLNANVYSGISTLTKTVDVMNTQQYVKMRKEAFVNDGTTPTNSTAPDLLLWDTTRYTNWKKYLIGNKAHTTDANVSLSGGNNQTQFLVGGGYHRQTTVFPGDLADNRASLHFTVNHQSADNRFKLVFTGSFGGEQNNFDISDLTGSAIGLAPNSPQLVNSEGNLVFSENGATFSNPLSNLRREYQARTDNYLSGLNLSYEILKGLSIKSNVGYNAIYVSEFSTIPIAAQNPANNPVGFANFSNGNYKSVIVEPQLQYVSQIGPGRLDALLGGTWQRNQHENTYVLASGYTSDSLLGSLGAAGSIDDKGSDNTDYKYAAAFARLNYNIGDRYIINLTGRRDGSSRFGPAYRYANFGAVGTAWIFSNENFIRNHLASLSFGKLRLSYGTTGNDKIGDYNYLDTWTALSKTYQGKPGLYPTRLFNPDYRWEINKKFELGLDLGLLRDRILFTANWYSNRSSNQLIAYTLPSQTGGSSITANFPAIVQNSGTEFTLSTVNLKTKAFEWTSTFNLSVPRNKLIAFPDIEKSSYNNSLIVGRSLSIKNGLTVTGVNATTGVYEFLGKDGKATSTPAAADAVKGVADLAPRFFGGLGNNFRYKDFQFDFFFEFKKQTGQNFLANIIGVGRYPGRNQNLPVAFLDRWTPSNTQTDVQKVSAGTTSAAYKAANSMYLYGADLFYSDASYARLKNATLSYSLPQKLASKAAMKALRIYVTGQNLLTLTRYKGGDPEVQNLYLMPPLKTITFGLQGNL